MTPSELLSPPDYRPFAVALLLLSACGGSESPAVDAGTPLAQDAGIVDTGASDTGPTDTGVEPDAGPTDTGVEPDAGPSDSGSSDTGPTDIGVEDAGVSFPTLADYRLCEIDTDCPVGLGQCIKELLFNRVDSDGQSAVLISDLDTRVPSGQGVCSEACTRDLSACDTMTLFDTTGAEVPFTCQVVALGASPYPATPPAYPFDTQIDVAEMVLGQPFAALCRPPFELDAAHNSNFCGACDSTGGCTGGTCWRFDTDAPVQAGEDGVCLETNSACPIGFEVRSLQDGSTDLGEHCVPVQETCGSCLDRDGDTWGAGHCLNVQVDCDDRNSSAYYDNLNLEHPFPAHCGIQDYNCNGLSDDAEQVGVEAYKASHCESCGDDADARTVNPGTASEALLECVGGQIQVATCSDAAQVHCSGDPRQTGCEATASTGGQTYYRDGDLDTYGDPNTPTLGCPGGGAPSGYVTDSTDCNDGDTAVHPNVPDICDCWGDCAQTGAQVDNDCDGAIDEDVTGYSWGTDADSDGAAGAAFDSNTYCGAPAANLVLGDGTEDCNDGSAVSYRAHTRITDAGGTILSLPLTSSPVRDSSGNLYTTSVSAPTEVCDNVDNDCVGGVDDGVQTTYYFDQDNDTFGDPSISTLGCSAPANYVSDNTDCDDSEITIYPNATELCDGIDRDCQGDGDALVVLGASCTTGLLGNCSAGTQTACVNAAFVCTQDNQAAAFDDPHNLPDDEDCDGAEVVIYVDPSGAEANAGTASSPKATVVQALAGASALGATQVHMLAGAHVISEPVVLVSGLDIVGGLSRSGNVWTAGGGQSLLMHDGTAVSGQAVLIDANRVTTTVANLDLQMTAGTEAGVHHFGVYAFRSHGLALQSMTMTIAAGTDGVDGGSGWGGSSSPAGRINRVSCGSGTEVSGGRGGIGSTSSRLGDPGLGENPGVGGSVSQLAGAGGDSASAAGAGAAIEVAVINGVWTDSGVVDPEDGLHGSGGGGGYADGAGAVGGSGGSGGCGGSAGENGQSGGSVVGIFSFRSGNMGLSNIIVSVAGGGAGGAGGDGGDGGVGGGAGSSQYIGIGVAYDGGAGSSGAGGGGGGGGFGGHAYPVFHQGTGDLCGNASLSNVVRNTTGLAGLAGAAGSAGVGASNLDGSAGTAGADGTQIDCFWSEPCTGTTCSNGNRCLSGFCQP